MYTTPNFNTTSIKRNEATSGETIEEQVRRYMSNNEPITGGMKNLTYTERKDGVLPGYNIRTDRWEIALDGMNAVEKSNAAKRDMIQKAEDEANSQSAQGTEE